jgi:anti-sigma regulatory factor (Ser/Thr protein kinase)
VAASVAEARAAVTAFAQSAGATADALAAVSLAVSEAVTNAVLHAYVGHPEPGDVHVTVQAGDDEVLIEVVDRGIGLAPRPDSPGLGYGLAVMMAVAKRFEAQTAKDQGTRLRAWFSRDPAVATPAD